MNGYDLSRAWFNYSFSNPEKIKPIHSAIFFFAVEHCNRLGWKCKFGFPTTMVMEAIGVKSYNSYKKHFDDIVLFGFFKVFEYSKNQYSANIIALSLNDKALDKALDKAFIKHATKQEESTQQSIDSIDKQINKEPIEQETNKPKKFVFLKSLLDNGADKELAKEWLLVRKTKKATNTETAFKGFLTQLSKTKLNINQVLRVCIENSWKGFNHDWVKDIKPIALEEETKELVTFYWEHEGRSNKRTIAKDKAEAYFKNQAVGGYIAVVL